MAVNPFTAFRRAVFHQLKFFKEFSMGQGDRKTRKGKIWRGSYGNTRKHQARVKASAVGAKAAAKKKK